MLFCIVLTEDLVNASSDKSLCINYEQLSFVIYKYCWLLGCCLKQHIKNNDVLLGDQPCKNGVVIQRFGDCICLHHQGWCQCPACWITSTFSHGWSPYKTSLHWVAVKASNLTQLTFICTHIRSTLVWWLWYFMLNYVNLNIRKMSEKQLVFLVY
jgi:hypothetical protein